MAGCYTAGMITPDDIEAIERATLDAVPPPERIERGRWLLAFDPGTVGRAHSTVPLRHEAPEPGLVAEVEREYARRSLPPVWRVPRVPCFDALRDELSARGYRAAKPTGVHTAPVEAMAAAAAHEADVRTSDWPTAAWSAVFLGQGFDPVDGAHRVRLLGGAREAVYASSMAGTQVAAVGAACFGQGWCGVHGMRTLPSFRRQGHAAAILAAFARLARARGIGRAFLQVEQGNEPARAVYRRAGFAERWVYEYWKR